MTHRGLTILIGALWCATVAAQQPPPVPKPFPGAGQATTAPPPRETPAPIVASAGQDGAAIDPLLAGVPMYGGAELLFSSALPRDQRLFVFGTNDAYSSVVGYYRTQLRRNGETVSRTPAIQQFDLGSFNASTMDQRPSIVVKDYTWPEQAGYVHVAGTVERRFVTLIQIIPAGR